MKASVRAARRGVKEAGLALAEPRAHDYTHASARGAEREFHVTSDRILDTIARVLPPSRTAGDAARARQDTLTKPQGALGRLEEISILTAGMTGRIDWIPRAKAIFTLAGDHGVVAEGVSLYPQAVTVQMVASIAAGGAGVNVIARHVGAEVVVADLGVAGDVSGCPGVVCRKVAHGTANLAVGPAMAEEQMCAAVEAGIDLVEARANLDLAGTGEMGIGNTTPATAIACALLGREPEEVVGPGTGLPADRVRDKAEVIRRALARNQPHADDPWDVLRKVGGFEIAGLVGVVLACAARRVPCIVNGFISTSAALIAVRACPAARAYLLAGHRSAEPGHDAMLEALELRPILDLGMRLGEGTGAALAMSVIEAAARVLTEMATFEEASVSRAE
jgi:nicotinate-nucleotide--dimethylbenzimidazole phosphoribosyltransferase